MQRRFASLITKKAKLSSTALNKENSVLPISRVLNYSQAKRDVTTVTEAAAAAAAAKAQPHGQAKRDVTTVTEATAAAAATAKAQPHGQTKRDITTVTEATRAAAVAKAQQPSGTGSTRGTAAVASTTSSTPVGLHSYGFPTLVQNVDAMPNRLWDDPKYEDTQHVHFTTMNVMHYSSTEWFQHEKKNLFDKTWLPAAFTSELDVHRILCRRIYGREVLIVKTKKDEIKAFYNTCRHRGARLVKQDCDQKTLICPYHAWRYDLDGNLKKTPRFDNPEFDKSKFGLLEIKCRTFAGRVMLNFNQNMAEYDKDMAVDFQTLYGGMCEDLLPYPLEDLKVVRTKKYDVAANWKHLIDNFQEYYHLPFVHPGLVQVSTMEGHICTQKPNGKYIGFKTDPMTMGGMPIDPDESIFGGVMPGMKEAKLDKCLNFHVMFPNTFWFLGPNHLFTVTVDPLSADRSIEHAALLVHKSVDQKVYKEQIDAMFEFYDEVNDEDLKVCEEVQRGIDGNDRYVDGIYVKPYEKTVQRFHDFVMDSVGPLPTVNEVKPQFHIDLE